MILVTELTPGDYFQYRTIHTHRVVGTLCCVKSSIIAPSLAYRDSTLEDMYYVRVARNSPDSKRDMEAER